MVSFASPSCLRAGDSIAWSERLDDYPASAGWSLSFRLIWRAAAATAPFEFAAQVSPDGEGFDVSLSAPETAGFTAGTAALAAIVSRDDAKITLGIVPLEILPNLAAVDAFDDRSENRRALYLERADDPDKRGRNTAPDDIVKAFRALKKQAAKQAAKQQESSGLFNDENKKAE
ncbi:MAG: hypothetical protein LBL72_08445 [Candidatus Accumulibacter sp.]|jgi:hypothetical protein|nr:hypothetical protein [Accumulibacter sp.]